MLIILFAAPVALSLLAAVFRRKAVNRAALISCAVVYAAGAVLALSGFEPFPHPIPLAGYFTFDSLGRLMLLTLAAVYACVSGSSLFYLKEKNLSRGQDTVYTVFLMLFLVSMTGGVLASHLGLLWVFVEATTLAGGMLISVEKEKTALEAVWKYIFICSIGVAFSFIGIIVLSIGAKGVGSLFFSDLVAGAGAINPFLLKLAFAFILAGFGTKMGLAPVHAWLPDAHSEAPAPVSALLSGALLNVAAVALIRFYPVMTGAGLEPFAGTLVLVMGFLSLLVSAAFILTAKNYKRLLAYSSIENMGIVAVGLGLGAPGLFAALLHMVVHSLAKSGLFLVSGNVYRLRHSKKIADVRGLLTRDPKTGWLWVAGFVALAGLPPFGVFWSKLFLARALIEKGLAWLLAPLFLLLVVVAYGLGKAVLGMAWGKDNVTLSSSKGEGPVEPNESVMVRQAHHDNNAHHDKLSLWAYLPPAVLLVLLLALGFFIPDFMTRLMADVQNVFRTAEAMR